jgi:flagellar hook-length control protein FliK
MIPADVASRLQLSADTALRPVAPAQEIADRLSGLVAGQKVMAEIQAMLPNGTYRALINQRSITLALPFSAKSGDSLELQVTEADGKLALAVVASPEESGKQAAATTSATLSRTGQLISDLFAGARDAGGSPAAATLNANQPLSATPVSAQDLLPQLKQAITQSGMFYESHQAEWVEGRFAKAALLQEPQGKLSSPTTLALAAQAQIDAMPQSIVANTTPTAGQATAAQHVTADAGAVAADATAAQVRPKTPDSAAETTAALRPGGDAPPTGEAGKAAAPTPAQSAASSQQLVAPQAQALVQQQLEALATQNFSWQGQIWPGQEMRWEIEEDAGRNSAGNDETAARWATQLHLTLPRLGSVDAKIRLQGNEITLSMTAGSEETRALMRASGVALRSQLSEAGITLSSMGVAATDESDGQAAQ